MQCPYCGKRTNDMPIHLEKNKKCSDKHGDTLKAYLTKVIHANKTQHIQ